MRILPYREKIIDWSIGFDTKYILSSKKPHILCGAFVCSYGTMVRYIEITILPKCLPSPSFL